MEIEKKDWILAKMQKQQAKIQRMKTELKLSEEQAHRIYEIFEQTNEKARPLMEQKAEMYKSAKQQIGNLLDNEQRGKWEAMKKD